MSDYPHLPPTEKFSIRFEMREDGGIRIWSDDESGLILSGPDPQQVMACVLPAMNGLRGRREFHARQGT